MEYISEHSTTLLSRYQVGIDGKTPYKRFMGKQCKQGPCDRIWRASTGKTNEIKANTAESVAEVQVG